VPTSDARGILEHKLPGLCSENRTAGEPDEHDLEQWNCPMDV
jgi:hypothetical protein